MVGPFGELDNRIFGQTGLSEASRSSKNGGMCSIQVSLSVRLRGIKIFSVRSSRREEIEVKRTSSQPNNPLQLGYVQITALTAPILIKILEIESEGATIPKIAHGLDMDPNSVREFIKDAERDSRQFLICNDWSSTKDQPTRAYRKRRLPGTKLTKGGGRHTDILEIRPDRLITNPLSAKIILLLAEESRKSREVNRDEFIQHLLMELDDLKPRYLNFAEQLNARINFLMKIGDICTGDNTVPNIMC
jgi:hypothetical protein